VNSVQKYKTILVTRPSMMFEDWT